jgi:DNA end-binding protein Ku
MAEQLIESMRGEWQPEEYRDTYREDVMARIQAKIEAGETHMVPTEGSSSDQPRSAEVIDLMSQLKKSIPAGGSEARKRNKQAQGCRKQSGYQAEGNFNTKKAGLTWG